MGTKELEERVEFLEKAVERLIIVANLHAFRLGETHFEFKNHAHPGDEELPSLLRSEDVGELKKDPMRFILEKYKSLFFPTSEGL